MKKLLLLLALGLTTLSMNAQDLRNANNSPIGKIESDGTVRNSSNSTVGKIEKDGTSRLKCCPFFVAKEDGYMIRCAKLVSSSDE